MKSHDLICKLTPYSTGGIWQLPSGNIIMKSVETKIQAPFISKLEYLNIYDANTGQIIESKIEEEDAGFHIEHILPDGRLIIANSEGTIKIKELDRKNSLVICEKSSSISDIKSISNTQFVSGHFNGSFKYWDINEKKCIHTCNTINNSDKNVTRIFKILANNKIISYHFDGTVQVSDINRTQSTILCSDVKFGLCDIFPDNKIITGHNDDSIKVWDSETLKCLASYTIHKDLQRFTALSNDILISAHWNLGNGKIILTNVNTGICHSMKDSESPYDISIIPNTPFIMLYHTSSRYSWHSWAEVWEISDDLELNFISRLKLGENFGFRNIQVLPDTRIAVSRYQQDEIIDAEIVKQFRDKYIALKEDLLPSADLCNLPHDLVSIVLDYLPEYKSIQNISRKSKRDEFHDGVVPMEDDNKLSNKAIISSANKFSTLLWSKNKKRKLGIDENHSNKLDKKTDDNDPIEPPLKKMK